MVIDKFSEVWLGAYNDPWLYLWARTNLIDLYKSDWILTDINVLL